MDKDHKELMSNNYQLKNEVNKIINNESEYSTLNNEFKINYLESIFEYFQKNSPKMTFLIEKLKFKIEVLKTHNINLDNNLLRLNTVKYNYNILIKDAKCKQIKKTKLKE